MKLNDTNWNHYRTFIVVYDVQNLQRASEILGITRPAVGHSIRELGRQLGVPLFTPGRRGVQPSAEAIALYPIIKQSFENILEAESSVQVFERETRATIRLAVPSTLASFYFKDYFKEFCRAYPNVKFEFFGKSGFELLAQKKIDLVIDLDHCFRPYNFKTSDVLTLHGTLVASTVFLKEAKIKNATISKIDAVTLPIIAHREPWSDLAKSLDLSGDPFMIAASTEFAIAMAQSSLGAAYYYDELLPALGGDLIKLKVSDAVLPQIKIVCGYNNHFLSKPAKAFIDGLISFCSNLSV